MKMLAYTAPAILAMTVTTGFAQTATDTTDTDKGVGDDGGNAMVGQDWPAGVTGAFFTDSSLQTLKADADIQAAWAGLPEEDRQKVMQDCAQMKSSTAATTGAAETDTDTTDVARSQGENDSTSTGGTIASDAGTPEPAGQTTDPAGEGGGDTDGPADTSGTAAASGSAAAPAAISNTNLVQLCSLIEGM